MHPVSQWVEKKRAQAAAVIGGIAGWIASLDKHMADGMQDTTVVRQRGSLDEAGRARNVRFKNSDPELILIPERPKPAGPPRHQVVKLTSILPGDTATKQDGGWGCEICGRNSRCLTRFTKQRCPGVHVVQSRAHSTHDLYGAGSLTICIKCGCYGSVHVRGLEHACSGHPGRTARSRLRRVLAGRHPESGEEIGLPTRLSREL